MFLLQHLLGVPVSYTVRQVFLRQARRQIRPDGNLLQHIRQPADMILVRVGVDYIIQVCNPVFLQIPAHIHALIHCTAVHQHEMPLAFQQQCIGLAHIQHMEQEWRPVGLRRNIPEARCAE